MASKTRQFRPFDAVLQITGQANMEVYRDH